MIICQKKDNLSENSHKKGKQLETFCLKKENLGDNLSEERKNLCDNLSGKGKS